MTELVNKLDRYSYSKISTYKQCKFKFHLRYLEKNFIFNDTIATNFGALIHKTEEIIAQNIQRNESINYTALKNNFIIESRKLAHTYPIDFFSQDKSGKTYQDKVYIYLEQGIYRLEAFIKQHPTLQIIGIEQNFEYNYDGVHSFTGSIDRAFIDTGTGELLIQDIKSWPVPAKDNELKAPLQLAIYMMAAHELWNIPLEKIKCEYDLPLCNIVQPALSDNVVEEGCKEINKLFDGIQANNFKPSITALCHWCEFNPLNNPSILDTKPNAVCPYFSTWQKSGDNVKNTLVNWQGLENVLIDRQFCISQLKQQNITS